jgi:hypothetical protein
MIDNITMIKKNLSEIEKMKIVKTTRLDMQSINGLSCYDNRTTKNFNGGFYIKISTDNILKIAGSLHKYHSYLQTKSLTNFDRFTMCQAKETILHLIDRTGFDPEKMTITFYEIGLNIEINIDPKKLLQNIYSIGNLDKPKEIFVNPSYKDNRHVTTQKHRDFRVYHKMYDKVFEMQDRRKQPPNNVNIIRIETTHRRVEKTLLVDFFTDTNLKRLQNNFFSDWDKLNFYNDVDAPTGTHKSKIELAKDILYNGKVSVMKKHFEQYKNGVLTIKMYYSIKKFIENWEVEKFNFKHKKSEICVIWQNSYSIEKQLIN